MRPRYPVLACAAVLALSGCSSGSAVDPARESTSSPSSSTPTATTSVSVPNAVPSGRPGAPRGGLPPRPAPNDADAVGQAAVETLRSLDRTSMDVFGDWSLRVDEVTVPVARAIGIVEGAAVALRCTPLELLDEYRLAF